jgi:predicted FMN-binding regulatory protein PaiB
VYTKPTLVHPGGTDRDLLQHISEDTAIFLVAWGPHVYKRGNDANMYFYEMKLYRTITFSPTWDFREVRKHSTRKMWDEKYTSYTLKSLLTMRYSDEEYDLAKEDLQVYLTLRML